VIAEQQTYGKVMVPDTEMIAARLGDRDLALKHSAGLVDLPGESDGSVPLFRARIAAILETVRRPSTFCGMRSPNG
jgi:hypothetical protein